MVDVFEEVEEDLRSDRWRRLFRQWWPWAAGVLALALIAALSVWGYDAWRTRAAGEASEAYDRGMTALQENNLTAAEAAFTEAGDTGSGAYKALSLMQRAGIAVQRNQNDQALALFDEAAGASRAPLIADAARLKAAYLAMDSASLADVTARLEPLTEEGRPYRPLAREALALARLQHGQAQQARAEFVSLSLLPDVPDGVRERANAAIQLIDSGAGASLGQIVTAAGRLPEAERATPFNPFAPQQPSAPTQAPQGAPSPAQ